LRIEGLKGNNLICLKGNEIKRKKDFGMVVIEHLLEYEAAIGLST
jgi:hypothetical protein